MVNGFSDDDLQRQPPRNRARIERRKGLLGPGYQLFYTDPVDVCRGQGVHLYDADGNEYLDAYNNVASIGHSHPAVTDAVARQLGILNTNTRYLQDQILDYSEDLLSTFPPELNRVTYTCTIQIGTSPPVTATWAGASKRSAGPTMVTSSVAAAGWFPTSRLAQRWEN
ncbi:aminotransferase class III-fold pyridoxal phosphate-dependent enzyme [Nocardia brasiliensis]|uniref:aminotransferase class III-fold pyridoxal phosphate-dependent enzyme n=1 Tax=Nocardia brasiliensis TaxID=37326 RepID=UPI003CC7D7C0